MNKPKRSKDFLKRCSKQRYNLRVRQTICSYCGEISTARTLDQKEKQALALEHILICKKRPELQLIDKLIALSNALVALLRNPAIDGDWRVKAEEALRAARP